MTETEFWIYECARRGTLKRFPNGTWSGDGTWFGGVEELTADRLVSEGHLVLREATADGATSVIPSSSAATPPASGSPMDLIGKTVRWTVQWEYKGEWLPLRWFTVNIDTRAGNGTYSGTVVNPGNYRDLTVGAEVHNLKPERCTVIDSEPDTQDPECE